MGAARVLYKNLFVCLRTKFYADRLERMWGLVHVSNLINQRAIRRLSANKKGLHWAFNRFAIAINILIYAFILLYKCRKFKTLLNYKYRYVRQ